ncbi:hypothetical protein GTG28_20585 [Vibrio sp. OCN044]|uniref:Uncharacterized protein n=1 Tax=Vibrio tetraodonis subsp. pristinus TaxID=2695891 RepID=A0A6L8LZQ2_9VIBR|nr:hypothetical protein [Vibrio tetraodonis]MYM61601.1 hypothetical protein [Vibrio tetraodonis subsp. pristinus]
MITLIISSEYETHTEQAKSLSELKRVVLDNYNVNGWKFWLDGHDDKSATFHKFFRGVKAAPKHR